jgi:Cu/Ag efflux pump CusA
MGLLIILGVITLPTLKRETFPEIKRYEIEVKIVYPGATPLEIEQKLCRPLEDAIDGTSFISPRGESIFVTGVPKSIMRRAVARLQLYCSTCY